MSATTCSSVRPSCATSLVASGLGDHADDPAAAFEDRVGDDPHQADPAAAVDQAQAPIGQDRADPAGGLDVFRIRPRRGAAVDADVLHEQAVASGRLPVITCQSAIDRRPLGS